MRVLYKVVNWFVVVLFLLSVCSLDSVSNVPFYTLIGSLIYLVVVGLHERIFTFQKGHYKKWKELY